MANDPINPWLDADELKQLAESLMQGGSKPKNPLPQDAGFSENFVGFAGGEPAVTNALSQTGTSASIGVAITTIVDGEFVAFMYM